MLFTQNLKLNTKQVENRINRFQKALPKVLNLIDESFLQQEKKVEYIGLISERSKHLGL